jgi:hypothetical protein
MSLDFHDIKAKIESWNKFHKSELEILSAREKYKLNENRNGIFVNLSCISDETRQELLSYQLCRRASARNLSWARTPWTK